VALAQSSAVLATEFGPLYRNLRGYVNDGLRQRLGRAVTGIVA
jgi:hypothetical protein